MAYDKRTNDIWSARKKSEILMAVNGPAKSQLREEQAERGTCNNDNDKLLSDPIERRAHAQLSVLSERMNDTLPRPVPVEEPLAALPVGVLIIWQQQQPQPVSLAHKMC